MHYKNGREAKTGDHVIAKSYNGNIVGGVIHDLNPNTEVATCNCTVSTIIPGGVVSLTCQTIGNLYHVEDAFAALEATFSAPATTP